MVPKLMALTDKQIQISPLTQTINALVFCLVAALRDDDSLASPPTKISRQICLANVDPTKS
jgi:hypothetical protein